MNLKSLLGFSEFFALDIGTTAVRIVQLRGGGGTKSLVRYGSVPIDAKTAESDSASDQKRLADVIAQAVKQTGVGVKEVVVGIPSNKMFATVVDFPKLAQHELEKTIQYQLETHIPMSISESKVDWAVLGDSPTGQDKVEVLISAVSNSFAEGRLDLLEGIGLNVVALEPDGLALCRSLLPLGSTGAGLIVDIGDRATDLVINYGGNPRLVRSIPTGGSTFVKAAQQNLNVDEKQATQFVYKFGLNQDKLEGQIYRALEGTIDSVVSEVQKSIKYFDARYGGVKLDKIIVSGGAATLPGFPLHLANKVGLQVEIGNAWLNVSYPQSKHNDLIALSNHFSVAVGLAERASI
ncbi:MAG TPA: type IV pilus assembly protein PilM [Candidatus Saccharimonadales bacterium]